ncbi:MAG: VWA domain-containing protein [Blastocatellales bacterium]|jgi:Ca-activated chloride channel family protein
MKSSRIIQMAALLLALTFLLRSPSLAQEHKHKPAQDAASLKLSTELVSLSVTVTDRKGQAIPGLKREDFKVYESGVEQKLDFFSAEEMPVCWGIVLDRSGSMMEMIGDVYRAAVHVVDEGTEEDEAFVVTFSQRVELVSDFMADKHKLENSILGLRAGGETALWDAINFALDHLKKAKHRKKVLVVITDGDDNSSRIKFRELIERAEEENVLIYPVGMFESSGMFSLRMVGRGPRDDLEKLAEVTGARAHFPTNVEQCREAMRAIAGEVSHHHQYSVGYYPSNTKNDGKWRKIQTVVGQDDSKTKYVARTRAGYYAQKAEEVKEP